MMKDSIKEQLKTVLEGAGRKQRFHAYTLMTKNDELETKKAKRRSLTLRRVLNKIRHLTGNESDKL